VSEAYVQAAGTCMRRGWRSRVVVGCGTRDVMRGNRIRGKYLGLICVSLSVRSLLASGGGGGGSWCGGGCRVAVGCGTRDVMRGRDYGRM
jgi:hypothetical protein